MADPSETTRITRVPAGDEPGDVAAAIRELSDQVGELQAEIRTLRAQGPGLPAVREEAGWQEAERGHDPMTWVHALDAPAAREPAVPRLLLEIVFLVAVATAAAIAELDLVEIVAVMAVAWALVALAEWAGARAARQRAEAVYAPFPGATQGYPTDPSWLAPPVERAPLEVVEPGEDTQTKLPPPGEE